MNKYSNYYQCKCEQELNTCEAESTENKGNWELRKIEPKSIEKNNVLNHFYFRSSLGLYYMKVCLMSFYFLTPPYRIRILFTICFFSCLIYSTKVFVKSVPLCIMLKKKKICICIFVV